MCFPSFVHQTILMNHHGTISAAEVEQVIEKLSSPVTGQLPRGRLPQGQPPPGTITPWTNARGGDKCPGGTNAPGDNYSVDKCPRGQNSPEYAPCPAYTRV